MKTLSSIFLGAFVFAVSIQAQTTATTNPVGFNTITCKVNSDTYCSVPFAQSIDFQGLVSGTPSVGGGAATITPQGTVTWTANGYAGFYFVRMLTGAKAGMYYQVTSNAASTVTIDLAGDDFSGVGNNDGFTICKFWTLSTLFPPATQTTIVVSLNTLGSGRRTELLLPDTVTAGINLAPNHKYFISGGAWREAASGSPISDNVILPPDGFFIVRHNNANITSDTTFTSTGNVELNAVSIPLATLTTGKQDNPVSTGRPIPVKLKDLDLISTGAFVGSNGTLGGQRRDELLLFDNSVASVNRSASATYFYNIPTANWRQSASGSPVADDVEIAPGTGILIRKYASTGATFVWTHTY